MLRRAHLPTARGRPPLNGQHRVSLLARRPARSMARRPACTLIASVCCHCCLLSRTTQSTARHSPTSLLQLITRQAGAPLLSPGASFSCASCALSQQAARATASARVRGVHTRAWLLIDARLNSRTGAHRHQRLAFVKLGQVLWTRLLHADVQRATHASGSELRQVWATSTSMACQCRC